MVLTKRLTPGNLQSELAILSLKYFPTIFDSHLKLFRKMQKCIYLKNSARFQQKYLLPGYLQSELATFLEFPRKTQKNALISETLHLCIIEKHI